MFTGWRTSTYSQTAQGQCVEVGTAPGRVGVRDTKSRERGQLTVSRATWRTFVRQLGS